MDAKTTDLLVRVAEKYWLTPSQAVALPAVFEVAANKVGISPALLLDAALSNSDLGLYIASIARTVEPEVKRFFSELDAKEA